MTLYETLGVSKNATPDQIKKAHRKLVKKLHPDMGGDPIRFAEVQAAYEVLSNKELRKEYDASGEIPKRNPDNISPQSYELFLRLFIATVQQIMQQGKDPEHFDLVEAIKNKANEMLEKEVINGIKNLNNTNAIMEKMIKRFKSKGGKEPFVSSIFRGTIEKNKAGIVQLEAQRKIILNLLDMLEDLVFDMKQQETRVNINTYGNTTSSTVYFRF